MNLQLKDNTFIYKKWLMLLLTNILALSCSGLAFAAQATKTTAASPGSMGMSPIVFFLVFLVICIFIGIFAVLAGVGGGVIFTPLMMGFTPIDSMIIRATGLFVAMSGALVAARPFLRRGLANIKMLFWAAAPYALSCVTGALMAGYVKESFGLRGEACVRGGLGIIVIGIALLFVFAGNKIEYPDVGEVDSFTERLGIAMSYWEESLGRVIHYKVKNAAICLLLFCGVGLISGFFGLGAGWAMVPVFNLVMAAPLKVAAACSKVLIGLGDTAAVWPYINNGALFPLFAVPCMIGLIIGTLIGTKIMVKVKAGFIRWIIILIMSGAGIRLILKAIKLWCIA